MKNKRWLVILGTTFIVVLIWLGASVITVRPSVELDPSINQALEEVNPNFDTSIIEQVKDILIPATTTRLSTPSASLLPSPSALPSAPTPQDSTPSATLNPPIFISTNSGEVRSEF